MVAASIAIMVQNFHHFQHRLRQRDGGIHGFSGIHHIVEILDVQINAETWLEILLHHHGRFGIHHGTSGQTAANGFKNFLRFYAAHLPHLHSFG